MALINITQDGGKTLQQVEESTLQKRVDMVDNDNETTTTVEYCFVDCQGQAHISGDPDSHSHFCNKHVHRSASVLLKDGIFAKATEGSFL